jgi:phosphatidylethanolamine/phosphatidyl-N-methylethanolamine N-methyltransferase
LSSNSFLHTIQRFIRNPGEIGAIAPSSSYLAKRMIAPINFNQSECIVELGAGTGPITDALVAKKSSNSLLIALENEETAFHKLEKRYQGKEKVQILQADASRLSSLLKEIWPQGADAVLSGLPFASLGSEKSDAIIKEVAQSLRPDGLFIAFQYTPFTYSWFAKHFRVEHMGFEVRNLPPAFVFHCTKKRP